ncbi:MAG: hypothetical protein IMY70_02300 [Bacteroidetes bacterium]|nr:hypothetical protein [Bacteroidota bacterium]
MGIHSCLSYLRDRFIIAKELLNGSGTTTYVTEQWGWWWITIDTSRIALNIAKTHLVTTTFPYYKLFDERLSDIRQGFIYKKVPHITLKSLANNEPPEEEKLFEHLKVAGVKTGRKDEEGRIYPC